MPICNILFLPILVMLVFIMACKCSVPNLNKAVICFSKKNMCVE